MKKKLRRLRRIAPVVFAYCMVMLLPSVLLAYYAYQLCHYVVVVYACALCVTGLVVMLREIILNQYIDFSEEKRPQ